MSVLDSTAVELFEPVLSEAEQATLLGFLASYRGCTREAYSLDLRQFVTWCAEQHRHLFGALPLRRRRRRPGSFTRSARPAAADRLRVARRSPGSQRSRSPPRRRRVVQPPRSRLGVVARVERAARLRSPRRADRRARPGTRASHADGAAQGRQDRHDAARTASCPGGRPGHRRTHRGTDPRRRPRRPSRPPRRRENRSTSRPSSRDRQACRAAHAAPRVHHRRARRRRPTARRSRSSQPRRPTHHHALRPRTPITRPARHLHRRHLHRRRLTLSQHEPRTADRGPRRRRTRCDGVLYLGRRAAGCVGGQRARLHPARRDRSKGVDRADHG